MFKPLLLIAFSIAISAHAAELPKWIETTNFSGDLRLRYDIQQKENSDAPAPDRHRNQIRARLLTTVQPMSDVTVGFRLATADASNTVSSNNTTMDGAGADKPVWFDQAYVIWQAAEFSKLIGGKMENPFFTPGRSQLIFDVDFTPEGAASVNNIDFGAVKLFGTLGAFWMDERVGGDAGLMAAQLAAQTELGGVKFTAGASDYYFSGVESKAILHAANGNTIKADGTYAEGFNVINGFIDASFEFGLPLGAFADVVENTFADGESSGFLVGARVGQVANKGDWMVSYSYRKVDANAVVGGLRDSDFANGMNNSSGHTMTARYGLGQKSYIEAYASLASVTNIATGDDYNFNRYMADLVVGF